MKFTKLDIEDAFLIELNEFKDERGSFARQYCKKEFEKQGIDFNICQCNISKNYKKGVLRGLHYSKEPYPEGKIVSCLRGKCFDVFVDLRKDSKTYLKWLGFELSEDNCKMLYIPPYCAHGFQTLTENTVLYYQLSEFFMPEYYAGVRYNDPKLSIEWKISDNLVINERDQSYDLL